LAYLVFLGEDVSVPEWSVRVRAASRNEAVIQAGKHRLQAGASITLGDADPNPSSLSLFLGSAASDLCTSFYSVAARRRAPIDSLEVLAKCRLQNPMVALGVIGEEGCPAISDFDLTLFVASDAESAELESVWQEALRRSPIIATLKNLPEVSLSWRQI
jgi:uncharacterized OsmC-like protein